MTLGMFMYAFGWVACIIPAGGMGGGATGLSMLLNAVFPALSIGTFVFIINALLLIIAGFIIGWNFGIKTIYCIIVLSIAMDAWDYIIPPGILVEYTQNIDSHNILLVILGAIIAGSGVAIGFSQGGSTGGTDIAAVIINHYRTVSYGKILIYSDLFIIGSSLFVGYNIATVIYGYIMTAVVGYTVDMIQAGSQQSNQVLIVSQDPEKMADAIAQNIHRGVTLLDAQGWYSKKDTKVVMVVCRKRETPMLLKYVKSVDPGAFMTVGSVMGVYGQGFETLNKI